MADTDISGSCSGTGLYLGRCKSMGAGSHKVAPPGRALPYSPVQPLHAYVMSSLSKDPQDLKLQPGSLRVRAIGPKLSEPVRS